MKLDYKILWLDDKMDAIRDDQYDLEIKKHLEEQGFNPIIVTVKNETDFFKHLDDSLDLILTDYHLNETGNNTRDGDAIIRQIREGNIFTEIMFYTAQGTDLEKIGMDRITFVDTKRSPIKNHNEAVIASAKKLIDLTVKKFQHIVSMRGMIMQETSGIDAQMLNIVDLFVGKTMDPDVINRVFEEIIGFHSRKLNESQGYKDKNKVEKILKDPLLFSSSQRANALEEIIFKIGFDNFIPDLKTSVIKTRNDFAHAEYVKDPETGREYFRDKKDGIDFNEEKCKEIRTNIIQHKANIDRLASRLVELDILT